MTDLAWRNLLRSQQVLLPPLGLAVVLYSVNALNQLHILFYLHYAETVHIALFGGTLDFLVRLVAATIVVALDLLSNRSRLSSIVLMVALASDSLINLVLLETTYASVSSAIVVICCLVVASKWYLSKASLLFDLAAMTAPSYLSILVAAALGWIVRIYYPFANFGANEMVNEYMILNILYPALTSMYVFFLFSWLTFPVARRLFRHYSRGNRGRLTKTLSPYPAASSQKETLPSLFLLGVSFLLAAGLFWYVYSLKPTAALIGQDLPRYIDPVNKILEGQNPQIATNRLLIYFLLAYAARIFSINPIEVLKYSSLALMALTAIATFMLVYIGRKSSFEAALSSFLAVTSVQTVLGFYAGIISNWLAIVFLMLTLTVLILPVSRGRIFRAMRVLWKYSIAGLLILVIGLTHRLIFAVIDFTTVFAAFHEAICRRAEARWFVTLAVIIGGGVLAWFLFYGQQIAYEYAYLTQGIGLTPGYVLSRIMAPDGPYVLSQAFDFTEMYSVGYYSIYPVLILGSVGMFTLSKCRTRFETLMTFWMAAASLATYLLAQFGITGSIFTWTQLWRGLFVIPMAIPTAIGLNHAYRFLTVRQKGVQESSISLGQSVGLNLAIAVLGASALIAGFPLSLLGVYVATSFLTASLAEEQRRKMLGIELVVAVLLAMTVYMLRSLGLLA